MQSATIAQVQSATKQWLSDGEFVLEVIPFPKFTSTSGGVDRSKLPEVAAPPESKMPKLQRATLSNGLKMVVAERHDAPVVDAIMLFDAGYAADQFASPGVALLTMSVLTDGTKSRNALRIADDLQRLGAQLQTSSTLDSSAVFLSAIKPKLDDSLALFADVILNPSFPDADFQREKRLLLAKIEQERIQPLTIVQRVLPAIAYGSGHAYGNPLTGSGTTASVGRIGRADLIKFHATWIKPNAATLILVGDTTLMDIQPKVEKLFSGWQRGAVPKKNLARVNPPAKTVVYLVDRPGALQSWVVAGEAALPKNSPQEIATEVMNDLIGGTFSSRLNMNLREDKHWSYGAVSRFVPAKGQQPFLASAPVQTDKTRESLVEMNRELHNFATTRPVTEAELEAAIGNRTLRLAGSRESLRSVANTVQQIVEFGYPDDYFDTYVAKVRNVRIADVQDAAKSVMHPDNLIWIIVGDRAKIEAGIRELNLGELRLIDADGIPIR
jgi:zinc protease